MVLALELPSVLSHFICGLIVELCTDGITSDLAVSGALVCGGIVAGVAVFCCFRRCTKSN